MPVPDHLAIHHLQAAVVPDVRAEDDADHATLVAAALDAAGARLTARTELLDAWELHRLPRLPAPPDTTTLQRQVQAARVRLRQERVRVDRLELQGRRFVVDHVRGGLA